MTIDATEYDDLRADTEDTFCDLCRIGSSAISAGYDPTNVVWAYGTEKSCGFDAGKSREVSDGSQATITDAVLRIGLDNLVSGLDRIQVTQRDGEAVTEYYAIIGEPRRGISCFVLNLKRLTGNSIK